ncbi:hypothetical protein PCURB6_18170 [Paenibacillus curdlanolyticus]|nr:hypothetical protein PCURB6_18170 [Paenibacillus curdlanolyticus]
MQMSGSRVYPSVMRVQDRVLADAIMITAADKMIKLSIPFKMLVKSSTAFLDCLNKDE